MTKFTKKKIKLKRKKNNKKTLNCSANSKNKFTCYSKKSLEVLRQQWNTRHPDKKISSENPRSIWSSLKRFLGDTCATEACWMRQKFMENGITNEMLNYTFAPAAPKSWETNPNTWLTSVDISKVMKQYERKHPSFLFIGPSPIDYDARESDGSFVWEELATFNLKKEIKRGKKKIGVIFNTDDHTKSGAHWISLFINIETGEMNFFDSVGDKAPNYVKKICNTIKDQASELNKSGEGIKLPEFKFDETHPHEHQQENTECGIYSLYFISNMITKNNFSFFKTKVVDDEDMEKFRNVFFNKPGTV